MDRFMVPRLGLLGVVGLAFILIGVIVLRSPDTHTNLRNTVDGSYYRTAVGMVAAEGQTMVVEPTGSPAGGVISLQAPIWLTVPDADMLRAAITDPGERLYVTSGCARCHGLGGKGGVVGPPLAGLDPQIVAAFARLGPGGMPVFSEEMLSDDELADIGTYLSSLEPVISAEGPAPTPTPAPTPAPAPVTPGATPTPEPTTVPPAPVATPGGDPVKGSQLYAAKCAVCHGKDASGGLAPALEGVDPDKMEEMVRKGKGGMPAFKDSTLSEQDLEDIIAFVGAQ